MCEDIWPSKEIIDSNLGSQILLEIAMRRKKHNAEDFKREKVKLLLTREKTQKPLCDELGVPYGIIGRWKKELDLDIRLPKI